MKAKKLIPAVVLLAVALLIPRVVTSNYSLQYLINMLMFAYFANAWNIIGGYAGQMAQGNGVYVGVGAYITAAMFMYEGISPWVGMLIGGAVAALMALAVGAITFRLNGTYFALSTVALLHVARMLVMSVDIIFGYDFGGPTGLYLPWIGEHFMNMQFTEKSSYYYVILFLFLVGLVVSAYIKNSKTGYYLAAINTNQEAASSLGVNVLGMKLRAYCTSAFLMALGGGFYAMFIMVVDPTRVLGYDMSIQIVLYAIIGGKGTLWGPILAAFVMSPLSDWLRAEFGSKVSGLALMFYGLITMLIVLFMPGGLWPFITEKVQVLRLKLQKAKTKG